MTDQHAATRDLLVRELDAERFSHPGYLRWFYDDNPRGAAIQQHEDDAESGRRIAHYGVLPTRFRHGAETTDFIFSSNVATDSSIRRGGLFRRMAERMYATAASTGAPAMVGVGNDASTVVVVDRFGWVRLGPMRAKIVFPVGFRRARRVESIRCGDAFLRSDHFAALTADLDSVPVAGWAQSWDTDFLRWKLSRPDGGYVLHVDRDALAVSVRAPAPLGFPAGVLLKVLPRRGAKLPVGTSALVAAIARFHRAPLVVYAGWNAHARVLGVPVPHKLQPSPLNVVLKVLDPYRVDGADFQLDTWEFLDMDAY